MKNHPLLAIVTLQLFLGSALSAAVITDTNITLSTTGGPTIFQHTLTINQNPVAIDPTSITFFRQGGDLSFIGTNLDEGSEWYLADYGEIFNASTISQGQFTQFGPAFGQSLSVGLGEFYLAVNTTPGLQPQLGRTIFGWAHFRNSESGLELLGSGVSYDDPSIVVGTTMIPEPWSASLFGVSLGAWSLLRRRKSC